MPYPTRSSADAALSSDRMERLIAAIHADHAAGLPIDEEGIVARHPELAAGVRRALGYIERVEAAAGAAIPEEMDAAAEQELEFLNGALPAYEVLEKVNYGGQGVVYRAVQRATGRHVAVKVLLHGRLATLRERHRFEREVEILASFDHPNIVTVYESGVVERRHYVVMQFVEGVPVETHLLFGGPSARDVVELFVSVCRAIEYAHQRGVIHRDIKPENIIVDSDGRPFVLDFGLAKDLYRTRRTFVTAGGERLGTPAYFSPEQAAERESEIDTRSDIYSLGVTLFNLITQSFPYDVSDDVPATRRAVCEQAPCRMAAALARSGNVMIGLNDDLEEIIRKAMAKEKERRYASAGALADDLERYLRGEAVTAKADSRVYVLRKTLRHYRAPLIMVGLMLAMSVAATALIGVAWSAAQEQRDRSRRTAHMSHGLLDAIIGIVDDRVSSLAGGRAVREQIMDELSAQLPALLESVRGDAEMRQIEAAVRLKQGDIEQQRGRTTAAEAHYRTALHHVLPGSLQQVRAYRRLGQVCDDFDRAFQQALKYGAGLAAGAAETRSSRYELVEVYLDYEQRLFWLGRYDDADAHVDHALRLLEGLQRLDARGERLLARTYLMRANLDAALGRDEQAIAACESALALRRSLHDADPANVDARHELMLSYQWLGDFHERRGNADRALELYEEACRIGRALLELDPGVAPWMREQYGGLARQARILIDTRKLDQAHLALNEATALAKELRSCHIADRMGERIWGSHCMLVGDWHYVQDELHAALDLYTEALTIRRSLVEAGPEAPDMEAELANTLDAISNCHRRMAQWPQARQNCEAALQIRQRLLRAHPESSERASLTAISYVKLTGVLLDAGEREAAVSAAEQAQGLLDGRLADKRGDDHRVQKLFELLSSYRARLKDPAATNPVFDAPPPY